MPRDFHPFGPWGRPVRKRGGLGERLQRINLRAALIWMPLALMPIAIGGPPIVTYMASDWGWELSIRHHAARTSCASARAVGLAPAREGQPGYWPHLDRNDDGWACEGSAARRRK